MKKIFGILAMAMAFTAGGNMTAGTCCNSATTICVVCSGGSCGILAGGAKIKITPKEAAAMCSQLVND